MELTDHFYAAFGDELKKIAGSPGISPDVLKALAHAGIGAGALYGGQKLYKDWKSGREARLRDAAMRRAGGGF